MSTDPTAPIGKGPRQGSTTPLSARQKTRPTLRIGKLLSGRSVSAGERAKSPDPEPLKESEVTDPAPGPNQLLIRVRARGVCRTDLHVFDGELSHPKLPLIIGHEIVGTCTRRSDSRSRSHRLLRLSGYLTPGRLVGPAHLLLRVPGG